MAFDTETGEVWLLLKDDNGNAIVDHDRGHGVVTYDRFPAPLRVYDPSTNMVVWGGGICSTHVTITTTPEKGGGTVLIEKQEMTYPGKAELCCDGWRTKNPKALCREGEWRTQEPKELKPLTEMKVECSYAQWVDGRWVNPPLPEDQGDEPTVVESK